MHKHVLLAIKHQRTANCLSVRVIVLRLRRLRQRNRCQKEPQLVSALRTPGVDRVSEQSKKLCIEKPRAFKNIKTSTSKYENNAVQNPSEKPKTPYAEKPHRSSQVLKRGLQGTSLLSKIGNEE